MNNENNNKYFKNQVAIISGGSSNIGEGIAGRLAEGGAKVYLIARTESKLISAVEKIVKKGGNADYRVADMTKPGDMEKIIDEIYSNEKRLDILVNNAGQFDFTDLEKPFSVIDHLIETDYKAPLRVAYHVAKSYTDIKILTTLSHAAFRIMSKGIGYGSAKAGLLQGLIQIDLDLLESGKNNLDSKDYSVKNYRLYPAAVSTPQLLELYKQGVVEGPTTLKSVVDVAEKLLKDETPTKDAFIGYVPKKGIVTAYYDINLETKYNNPNILNFREEEILDKDYAP